MQTTITKEDGYIVVKAYMQEMNISKVDGGYLIRTWKDVKRFRGYATIELKQRVVNRQELAEILGAA